MSLRTNELSPKSFVSSVPSWHETNKFPLPSMEESSVLRVYSATNPPGPPVAPHVPVAHLSSLYLIFAVSPSQTIEMKRLL